MLGQAKLFNDYYNVNLLKPVAEAQRPRNFFMPDRNLFLVYRYYFYAEIKFYRYDKCLSELEQDVFLTACRITGVLTECSPQLDEVMKQKPTLRELQKKFPRYTWL
jgi:hypothetical protein